MIGRIRSEVSEFRPAIRFVGWFIAIYLAGNLIYGVYVEWYKPLPDPVTAGVTGQSVWVANHFFSANASIKPHETRPVICINRGDDVVLNVFEGCNGINVMIVFVAFVVAFDGSRKKMIAFLFSGLLIIHLFNLVRINLLYYVALEQPDFFYYFHKYLFTAFLYLVVFALWYIWIRWSGKRWTHVAH